jgi:hypothetical protein
MMADMLADIRGSGHNITHTVFMECGSMYRRGGPPAFAPVGETEFVTGIAAMAASGTYGPTLVSAGITGCVDLSLGPAVVEPVLRAHLAYPRFRAVRCPIPSPVEQPAEHAAFRESLALLAIGGKVIKCWYPLNVATCSKIHAIIAVIEHVQIYIST